MAARHSGAIVRAEAARVVDAVVTTGRSLDAALDAAPEFMNPADKALLRYLSYGALRNHWQLAEWLDSLMQRPLRKRDSLVGSLLRVGIYQLTDSRVPDHAAVSMTVEAARLIRQPKFASLINAVLRNFRRRDLETQPAASEESRYLHPQWLIDAIRADWPDRWQEILRANNERAPMWLRVNRRRCTTAEYLERLHTMSDARHAPLPGIDSAIRLAQPLQVGELPGFAEGDVSVQDAAAQIAGHWLADAAGRRYLDACAAPGGKTGHLLELMADAATLTAVESDAARLQQVSDTLLRLGRDATLVHADASKPRAWWNSETFDRILLDAPCSASGVIRRHPDIKLLRRPGDLVELAMLQQNLLRALWDTLAPGGMLLYATCSVLAAENDEVVSSFMQQAADVTEISVLPNNNIRALMQRKACGYQILPGTAGLDGFYYACLQKTAD